jgi:hypothetical protein
MVSLTLETWHEYFVRAAHFLQDQGIPAKFHDLAQSSLLAARLLRQDVAYKVGDMQDIGRPPFTTELYRKVVILAASNSWNGHEKLQFRV